jgi:hypothetical protein
VGWVPYEEVKSKEKKKPKEEKIEETKNTSLLLFDKNLAIIHSSE